MGVLADFLEVEDRYEHVVDDFLRDELNYIVVKSWDAADEGLRLLRSDVDGRATFLVHPEDSQAKFSFCCEEAAITARQRDSVVPLKHCIRVLDGFGKSLEVILPKLGNGYIVPDPNVGRELALQNPDAFFLSQSGECFHNVTVTGGKQRSEGPLSMKRELREVLRQVADLERAMAAEQARVAALDARNRRAHRTAAAAGRRKARSRAPGNDVRPHPAATRRRDGASARAAGDVRARTDADWSRSAASARSSIAAQSHGVDGTRGAASRRWKPRCRRRRAASTSCAAAAMRRCSMPAMRGRTWPRWKSAVAAPCRPSIAWKRW